MTVKELLDELSKLSDEELKSEVYVGVVGTGLYLTTKAFPINDGFIIQTKGSYNESL